MAHPVYVLSSLILDLARNPYIDLLNWIGANNANLAQETNSQEANVLVFSCKNNTELFEP